MRSRTKGAERRRKTEVVGFFVIVDFLRCKKAGDLTQTHNIIPTVPFGVVNLPFSPSAATPFSGEPLREAKPPIWGHPKLRKGEHADCVQAKAKCLLSWLLLGQM